MIECYNVLTCRSTQIEIRLWLLSDGIATLSLKTLYILSENTGVSFFFYYYLQTLESIIFNPHTSNS